MIHRPQDQRLKSAPVKLDIFCGIDSQVLGFSQRLRSQSSKHDDQNVGPFPVNLLEQLVTFFCPQVDHQQRGRSLMQNRLEPIDVSDVA